MNNKKTTPTPIDKKQERVLKMLRSREGKIAEAITQFAGSMPFIYLHAGWFAFWILANDGLFRPIFPIFDPFPYGLLTMLVSLEAIFLSTFIMVAQNRQALLDRYRDLLDVKEQQEDEQQQEELEEDVEDLQEDVQDIQQDMSEIQKDLDDIVKAVTFIQQKVGNIDKVKNTAVEKEKKIVSQSRKRTS